MLDFILEVDHKLFLWLNNSGSEAYDWFWLLITNKLINFFVYVIVLIYLLKKLKKKSFGLLVACLCVLILLSDQSSNLLKYFFERLRPCHDDQIAHLVRLVKQNCGGLYSFFSAHASNSFALATFFYFVFKKIIQRNIIFFFLLAALIGYSRIYIGVHYPLDVISGSVFGFISGFVIFRFWVFSLKRINGFNS